MMIAGGLVGCVGTLLYFNKSEYDLYFQRVMIGVFCGGLAAMLASGLYELAMLYRSEANDPFKAFQQNQKETMRKMEQMKALERHDEVIYYDATEQHGRLYELCCCPPMAKITNKRVIYTVPNPQDVCCLPDCITSFWCKRVETMDYRLIDDISVEQTCGDFMSQTGTMVMHIRGSNDVSILNEVNKSSKSKACVIFAHFGLHIRNATG